MRHEHPTANEIAPTSDDGALFHSSFLPPLQQSSA
jgi:hypothetical protein